MGTEKSDSERLAAVETNIEGLSGQMKDLSRSVDSLVHQLVNAGKTNWVTMFGAGTMILAIMALVGAGYVRDIDELKVKIQTLEKFEKRTIASDAAQWERLRITEVTEKGVQRWHK